MRVTRVCFTETGILIFHNLLVHRMRYIDPCDYILVGHRRPLLMEVPCVPGSGVYKSRHVDQGTA